MFEEKVDNNMKVVDLRTEYLKNPMGIDIKHPRFMWSLEGKDKKQTAYQIQVLKGIETVWDSGRIESSKSIHVTYEGHDFESRDIGSWRVKVWNEEKKESDWSEWSWFELGLLKPSDWIGKWLNPEKETDPEKRYPAAYFRKEFNISDNIRKARLYVTCCGIYEVFINGERVGDQVLTPGITSYKKRLQYQTYDVSEYLMQGTNAIGIILGDGWFRGCTGMGTLRNIFGENISILCQMEIQTENEMLTVVSDETWKVTQEGPIRFNDLMQGEIVDARMDLGEWTLPGYCDKDWNQPNLFNWDKNALIGSNSVPIREKEQFKARVLKTPNGETVLDFQQNMSGYIQFSVKGKEGHTVELIHGEALDENGNFTMSNLQSQRKSDSRLEQKIIYTLGSDRREVFKPTFAIFGFRYVLLKNWPEDIVPDNFTAFAVYSDIEETASFLCSNQMVNQLVHNTVWSQKSNFVDIPTDCPQRERAGYTGDAQVFVETGSYLMDASAFFRKWLKEIEANQQNDGKVSNINPVHNREFTMFDGSAGWGDSIVIIPYKLFERYGDIEIIKENYDAAKKWVDYEISQAKECRPFRKFNKNPYKDYLWDIGFHWGEWLEPSQTIATIVKNTLLGVPDVCTAFLCYSSRLLAKMAEYLDKREDVAYYKEVSENARKAYLYQFTKNGKIKSKRQCQFVRPLEFEILDKKDRQAAADDLNDLVIKNDYHINTGFLTTPFICKVLTQYGHLDTAYRLLLQTTMPSWLYGVTKGATTIWESWNGIDEQGKPHASHNHYSYGAVVGWLMSMVSGINVEPINNHFTISPYPGGNLEWVNASYKSIIGKVEVKWEISEGKLKLQVNIPCNTTATIILPDGKKYEVEAGSYEFSCFLK